MKQQKGTPAQPSEVIQGRVVCSCELRLERHIRDAQGKEQSVFLCGASGGPDGYVLGKSGEDLSPMIAICNSCPIPQALESQRACLNLVPVRRFSGGKRPLPVIQAQTHTSDGINPETPTDISFPCRWFYPIYGQNQPRDTLVCQSCPHWFPRPPRERIPDYWPETQKMLRIVNGETIVTRPSTGFVPAPKQMPALSWWRRLLQKFHT